MSDKPVDSDYRPVRNNLLQSYKKENHLELFTHMIYLNKMFLKLF